MSLAEKTPAIYRITNLKNGRVYIGSTKDISRRFKQYIYAVNHILREPSTEKHNEIIHDIAKYGWDSFEFKILESSGDMFDPDIRAVREVEYIMKYRSILPEYGYNSTMGGESGPNKHRKFANRKAKAIFLYDTEDDSILLFLKGTSTVHEYIHCKKEYVPDAAQRGKLIKGRYFVFYGNTERRLLFADYIAAARGADKNNGKNDNVAQSNYRKYLKALKAVNKYAEKLEI